MVAISKSLNINVFPTVLVLRGGKEMERLEGQERLVERIVRCLSNRVTVADKSAHVKHRHRLRLEKALEMGVELTEEEEVEEERGQLDWTFDPEACGESMEIENDGMLMVLSEDQDKEDEGQWEYTYDYPHVSRRKWVPYPPRLNHIIEKYYKEGELYENG